MTVGFKTQTSASDAISDDGIDPAKVFVSGAPDESGIHPGNIRLCATFESVIDAVNIRPVAMCECGIGPLNIRRCAITECVIDPANSRLVATCECEIDPLNFHLCATFECVIDPIIIWFCVNCSYGVVSVHVNLWCKSESDFNSFCSNLWLIF
ncbi:hypothetical protein chiPu_0027608 [Chiloscyllium punctatum]|uniref:Uncharacterized protein n=1 Tax=Chiloscyllium punctatum TaxID=137246 RepID=A0A401TLQ7_CHIPU|nr:hypothetical protein [Chiloscyllium punctatum]